MAEKLNMEAVCLKQSGNSILTGDTNTLQMGLG
jgi:hypothetical protein